MEAGVEFVVKVQMPQFTTEAVPRCLVTNEDGSFMQQLEPDDGLNRVMEGRAKAYFLAEIDSERMLVLLEEVEYPGW